MLLTAVFTLAKLSEQKLKLRHGKEGRKKILCTYSESIPRIQILRIGCLSPSCSSGRTEEILHQLFLMKCPTLRYLELSFPAMSTGTDFVLWEVERLMLYRFRQYLTNIITNHHSLAC